ncbi:MAG: phage virion morphogenesis protein [Geothrix sp.]|nr:phage virion morphogenesis protein [Geothrix sp.]
MTPSKLLRNVTAMLDRANDPGPVLAAIGDLMVASADRNFEAEGRPAWAPVKAATAKRKTKAGHEKILMWSGALARSITFKVNGNAVAAGTNSPYGRIHNEGGVIDHPGRTGTVRLRTDVRGNLLRQGTEGRASRLAVFAKGSHKRAVERAFTHGAYPIPMPARPFLMFQPGETETYGALVLNYILTGRIGGQP